MIRTVPEFTFNHQFCEIFWFFKTLSYSIYYSTKQKILRINLLKRTKLDLGNNSEAFGKGYMKIFFFTNGKKQNGLLVRTAIKYV